MNHPSVNWLSKLDVDFCQRHQCRRPRMLHVSVPDGAWKYRARRLVDQFSIKWNDSSTKLWLCAVLNWSTNTAIGDSGHSPSQWVLGRSLRLPFQLLSRASQLASHQRHRDDFAYQRRVAMLADAQRSIISTRYNKALSRAFLSRARSANNAPSQVRFAVGDQVMYWRGNNKRKSQWSMRWLGPGIVIGHEGRANVWISHRNAVVKAAGNHVRLAEVEEQLPWHDLYDSLRETDEQTYFDLSPPGVSRDPQYGGPSTSSDVPMTPIPVPDESMPDVIADEPDTSEIPMLPILCMHQCAIHECVGVQMLWNILRHSLFYHLLCLRKMCLQPHHHGHHLCQSPVKRRRCNNLSHLTLTCNLSFHRQRPQQMIIPCPFLTLMIHHHGFFRNQKHRGFLPSKIHQ